ncbi:MAG: helix-turn-helix transcriptional regulator [Thermomicrobiales bacterium]
MSDREQEVLQLVAERLTNKEIGERLRISPLTVKRHTINIYAKLGVSTRRQAIAVAQSSGLTRHPDISTP